MDDTSTVPTHLRPPNKESGKKPLAAEKPHTKNIIHIVAISNKNNDHLHPRHKEDLPQSRVNLIKLTRRLAEEAEKGTLKGLGGFVEYDEGFRLLLEGSYDADPSTSALPLLLLQKRITDDIFEQEG